MTIFDFLAGLFSVVWSAITGLTFPGTDIKILTFFWGFVLVAIICKVISFYNNIED